jgi:hypothetical protein
MQIKAKLVVLLPALWAMFLMTPSLYAAGASPEVESLVRGFPSLDELETHLGLAAPPDGADPNPPVRAHVNSAGREGFIFPVSARWFTTPPPPSPFSAEAASSGEPGE